MPPYRSGIIDPWWCCSWCTAPFLSARHYYLSRRCHFKSITISESLTPSPCHTHSPPLPTPPPSWSQRAERVLSLQRLRPSGMSTRRLSLCASLGYFNGSHSFPVKPPVLSFLSLSWLAVQGGGVVGVGSCIQSGAFTCAVCKEKGRGGGVHFNATQDPFHLLALHTAATLPLTILLHLLPRLAISLMILLLLGYQLLVKW